MPFADHDCDRCEQSTDHVVPHTVDGRRLLVCVGCDLELLLAAAAADDAEDVLRRAPKRPRK